MATPAQIHANQLNSQKSTGPSTPEGKAASSANAFKHGLSATKVFPAARQEEFLALSRDFDQQFQPTNPNEERLVETLIFASWNLARFRELQEGLWQTMLQDDENKTMAQAFLEDCKGPKAIDKLFRYLRDLQRTYDRAHRELTKAREEAQAAELQRMAQTQAAMRTTSVPPPPPPPPGSGFVSSPGPTAVRRSENLALRL